MFTRLLLILIVVVLSGCESFPFWPSADDRAYDKEYNLDKPHGYTSVHKIKVWYPTWLVESDRPNVLRYIDDVVTSMKITYDAGSFPCDKCQVFIHEALDLCVAGYGIRRRVYGWTSGYVIYVPWQSVKGEGADANKKIGLATTDCLAALPHEFMHYFLFWRYGDSDPAHTKYFPTPAVIAVINAARKVALLYALSEGSVSGALAYVYTPWTPPKDWPADTK